jgi:hypothetical protein
MTRFILNTREGPQEFSVVEGRHGWGYVRLNGKQICMRGATTGPTLECAEADLEAVARRWWRASLRNRRAAGGWVRDRDAANEPAPQFELTFWGGVAWQYRRWHATYEAAEATARKVLADLENRAAHPATIHGPGCGRDGRTIL